MDAIVCIQVTGHSRLHCIWRVRTTTESCPPESLGRPGARHTLSGANGLVQKHSAKKTTYFSHKT